MKRSRKTVYLVIIGVGIVALALDRMFAGPKAASAVGAVSAPTESARSDVPVEPAAAQLRVEVPPFPMDIPAPVLGRISRDPFGLTAMAKTALFPPPPPEEPDTPEALAAVQPFDQRHELSAIIRVGSSRIAIIDDLSVATGQRIDGCVVEAMSERLVTLSCPEGIVELTLASPMGPERTGNDP